MASNHGPDSPYLAARQEWTERYGSYVQAARAWRIVGILGLSLAVIGFSYAMYLSTQIKLVPYIVEVDKLGTSITAASRSRSNMPIPVWCGRRSAISSRVSALSPRMPLFRSNISTGLTRCCGPPIRRPRRSTPVPWQFAVREGQDIDGLDRGQQHRGPLQPDLPDRLDRVRAGQKGQGNRHAPVSWDRDGDADRTAGRGHHPPQPDRSLHPGF